MATGYIFWKRFQLKKLALFSVDLVLFLVLFSRRNISFLTLFDV